MEWYIGELKVILIIKSVLEGGYLLNFKER